MILDGVRYEVNSVNSCDVAAVAGYRVQITDIGGPKCYTWGSGVGRSSQFGGLVHRPDFAEFAGMPKFEIEIADLAAKELKGPRAFDRRRVVEEVERQLADQPTEVSKNRKRLDSAAPDFEHMAPIWELRVGEFRVFYDVDGPAQTVYVRAVRPKRQDQTTEDVIGERD